MRPQRSAARSIRAPRAVALAIVGLSWAWAIVSIGRFMVSMLGEAQPGVPRPSVADFTAGPGPWIIVATVFVPLIVAATVNWLKSHGRAVLEAPETAGRRRARR